ncbi:HD domain-containing phosphohydrolase [Algisphaera agarilytica]|uniref:HD-GYP domain-containing protein (C-di-GMP phosphodiesterase class II) n=1 Tax=Algisphaera agarilytica TaxID=1385975 RepID=A0A7X0LK39_9BACT|nr:HD domain-containing phosphohydrolase [Algisphaera agarilytica]MBB6430035.1 HD-GYP domain-containing protein (c-di-GMP phosphodiesterase class II) [Algisphaera agarilytica]
MTPTQANPAPHRLADRIEAMGLSLLNLNAEGSATFVCGGSWFEKTLVESNIFRRAVKSQFNVLCDGESSLITLFPCVYLAKLKTEPVSAEGQTCEAVLMLGPELLKGEMLHRLLDEAKLDHQATISRIESDRLVNEAEANRIALTLGWMHSDSEVLSLRRRELHHLSEELADNYEELSLLYKLSCSMSLDQPPTHFFNEACAELQEVSGLGWIALQITEEQPRLQQLRGAIYTAGAIDSARPIRQLGRELMRDYGGTTDTTIIDDTAKMPGVASRVGSNLLIVPLVRDGQTLGVLFGGDRTDHEHIDSVDAKLCASLCNTLAIFLENLMFLEDAQSMFLGTLHALTSAIDAKDSYTFGHSERVALLSEMLARAAGIDEATVERIYLAGLVHDVGKIGVPERVLCKAGRLTDDEFELIKMHPGIGANMLRDIRQMEDLIPGVFYHHERWDGSGYPEKRAGHDIPLFGRVIGLADAFDAMSSDRTYRSALRIEEVLAEIERCMGSHFDPDLAEVFLNLDFEPYFNMIQNHHAARSFGSDSVKGSTSS